MVFLRTLFSHHIHSLLKHQNPTSHLLPNPPTHFISPNSHKNFTFSSFFSKPISSFAQTDSDSDGSSAQIVENGDNVEETKNNNKKSLATMFKEAVGLSEKIEQTESEGEGENDRDVKKMLRKLEKEVRKSKSNLKEEKVMKKTEEAKRDDGCSKDEQPKAKSLHALFSKKKDGGNETTSNSSRREPIVMKKLSPDVLFFLDHLYKHGYFNDANFLPKKAFEVSCFDDVYGREYIKFAAEKFGKDNQEIAKWLSGSDVKSVALFGCPSLAKKSILAAKRLRIFFKIQEDTVCSKCILKQSCKFVNQSVWKGDTRNLHLADVMKVITLYALEATPPLLVVPDEIKDSANRLLKEALNLSQTTS